MLIEISILVFIYILIEYILYKYCCRALTDEEEFEVMRGLITIKMNEIFK